MQKPKFLTRSTLFGYFSVIFSKAIVIFQICVIAKFHKKMKMPKFGTKNALHGYFWG